MQSKRKHLLEKINKLIFMYLLTVSGSTLRGDSFQSDSSGYVEEDMQNLLSSTNIEIS